MPAQIGSLYVSLTADFAGFQRNMTSAEGVVASTAGGMRRSIGLTERSVGSLQRTMSSGIRPYALISAARTFDTVQQRANLLRGVLFATTAAFGGLAAALTTNVVTRYFDSYTGLENQLRTVSDSTADLAGNFAAVNAIAERSRSSLAAVATLYARLQKSRPEESSDRILRRVETINKGLKLGGATAQEAASAAIQFSQAIASNRLGGDELRAVLETPLGNELAKGLGVTVGQLRKMGTEGKLTADVLFKALDKIANEVDQQFAKSISTIDQALTQADNAITVYAGHLDDTYGITKLVIGGIKSFADNLDTIIPLLATVGGALGANFAARLITAFGGKQVSGLVSGIKAVAAARRDDLRTAREQLAVAEKAHAAALDNVREARGVAGGDVRKLAPRADQKSYARDVAALVKADGVHLKLLDEKVRTTEELGEVSKKLTVAELKASNAIAVQQTKVNGILAEQARLKREASIAQGAVLNAKSGLSIPKQFANAEEAQAALTAVEKQQIVVARQLSAEETKLGKIRDQYTKANTASFVAAANQRADILVKEKQLVADLAASDARRAGLAKAAQKSGGVAFTAGYSEASRKLQEAESAISGTSSALSRAGIGFRVAEQGASKVAVGLGLARAAGASLIGFLGGPWGAGLTAAILGLELWASKSREAAEKVANAEQIIREENAKLTQEGKATPQIQLTELQAQLKAERDRLATLLDGLQVTRDDIANRISALAEESRNLQVIPPEAYDQLATQIDAFRAGTLTVEEMRQKLIALGIDSRALDPLMKGLDATRKQANDAAAGISALENRIADLDGKIARVSVEVAVSDPYGILTGTNSLEKLQMLSQYKQYGAGQTSLREAVELARKQKQLLDSAGEDSKVRNTGAKVAAREQELLEQGYAKSREEARKLAQTELDLEEKTRKASAAASSAAKDYQSFANKLRELQQEGEGAFLGNLDQKVLDFAKNLKDGSKLMEQYIAAINSGDLTKAPEELLKVRDALMQIGAADTWRDILQQYGEGAQLAKDFADKQAELNLLVANGKLTAEQAGVAYADFVTSFGQYQWINDLSSAITGFAEAAITDFDNIGDAAMSFLKQIGKIILQLTVLEPLQNALRTSLAADFTQPTGKNSSGGFFGSLFSGLFGNLFGGGNGSSLLSGATDVITSATDLSTLLNPAGAAAAAQAGGALMRDTSIRQSEGLANGMTSRGGAGAGRTIVDLRMSPDVEARIVSQSADQAVKISRNTVNDYDRNVLPTSVARVRNDPRARGGHG